MTNQTLTVLHETEGSLLTQMTQYHQDGLFIETCLRRLCILPDLPEPCSLAPGVQIYTQTDAYLLLLKICCGLESKIPGETEIFGQIKHAWRELDNRNPESELKKKLAPWFQKLFEDAKEIRTLYLQNLGSDSYGSLIRKLIQPSPNESILLVGAGQLAQTILPWLSSSSVRIYNRRPERAQELIQSYFSETKKTTNINLVTSFQEGLHQSQHVILCIPEDSPRDHEWISSWKKLHDDRSSSHYFIHLGTSTLGHLRHRFVLGLDELFKKLQQADHSKSLQIERAKNACLSKAQLRLLPVRSGYGWEDLPEFV